MNFRLAVAAFRIVISLAAFVGAVLTATGPATTTGLLPYFSIQTNLAIAVVAGYAAARTWRGDSPPSPLVKGAATLYLSITALVYHLVLTNSASGFAAVSDGSPGTALTEVGNHLLHTVAPLLAVLDWLLFDEHGHFRWLYAVIWLAYPLGYLGFALIRGVIRTEQPRYPYPFVDVTKLGYSGVAVSAIVLAVAFLLLGLIFVGIDRLLARRWPSAGLLSVGRTGQAPQSAGTADGSPVNGAGEARERRGP